MTDIGTVAERLQQYGTHIGGWREDAAKLRARAALVSGATPAETEELVALEKTATDIHDEIAGFKETVAEIAATSPAAAGELADVGETLHLLLLEITEIGTGMYRSRSAVDGPTPAEPVA